MHRVTSTAVTYIFHLLCQSCARCLPSRPPASQQPDTNQLHLLRPHRQWQFGQWWCLFHLLPSIAGTEYHRLDSLKQKCVFREL